MNCSVLRPTAGLLNLSRVLTYTANENNIEKTFLRIHEYGHAKRCIQQNANNSHISQRNFGNASKDNSQALEAARGTCPKSVPVHEYSSGASFSFFGICFAALLCPPRSGVLNGATRLA